MSHRIPIWALLLCVAVVVTPGLSFAAGEKAPKAEASSSTSLPQAYKREFAFLQSEKASLKQRLDQQRAESKQKVASAEGEIATLQAQVLATSIEADRLTGLLDNVAKAADSASEGSDVIETLLTQATVTLEKGNIKLPDGEGAEARTVQLRTAFEQSVVLLGQYASVRTHKGAFFTTDGKQVDGQLLTIGSIATYGVSDAAAGALAPAGQDRLKVWTEQPSDALARALSEGKHPDSIGIFLYESLDKGVEAKQTQSTMEHVGSGGIIAWVIVGLGAIGLLMIIVRALILGLSGASIDRLVGRVSSLVAQGDLDGAKRLCDQSRGCASRVLRVTIDNLNTSRERLEDAVSEAILHEHAKLDRFGSMILVVAAVAPLLGLLGTVTGMISTFDVITEFGTGDPKMLSGGISEALVTTELGLVVAIPALVAGNILSSWASGIKDALDKAALRISNVGTGVEVEAPAEPIPEPTEELAAATS